MAYGERSWERAMKAQEVILRAMSGEISWGAAAEILDVSARTVRRLRRQWETVGYEGLFDRRRRVPSPRRAPVRELEKVLRLYRERYRGFNVRHFHEKAREEHGVKLSYSFVRKALQEAGLVRKKRARGRHRRRREPRAAFGEMLHLDGSKHRWLELAPEGQYQTLICVIDDATKDPLYAQLWPEESTQAVLSALKDVVSGFGIPMALYTDRASWAAFTPRAGGPVDKSNKTQVGQALERLGVEHILSYSPQARGRIERLNRTFQDRLVNELRLHGIRTARAANRYIERRFLPDYRKRFRVEPRSAETAFVSAATIDLDQLLCEQAERTVGQDNVVTFGKLALQIEKQPGRTTCARTKVLVRRHIDGSHSIWRANLLLGRYDPKGRLLRSPENHQKAA